jgi:hypothetical protein
MAGNVAAKHAADDRAEHGAGGLVVLANVFTTLAISVIAGAVALRRSRQRDGGGRQCGETNQGKFEAHETALLRAGKHIGGRNDSFNLNGA